MPWRIVVSLRAGGQRALTAHTALELARLRAAAIANPEIADGSIKVWRIPDAHGDQLDACPSCGRAYAHRDGHRDPEPRYCRCGLVHLEHRCAACGIRALDPPPGEGCGPVPEPCPP